MNVINKGMYHTLRKVVPIYIYKLYESHGSDL